MDFATHSGKTPAPNYMRLMVSQVHLCVLMDAEVYIPEVSSIKKEVYAEFTRQYAMLLTHLKVNPAFELSHKLINMHGFITNTSTYQLHVELGRRRFMAANMEQTMHVLGEAERYLIPLGEAFRETGWTFRGMAMLTHASDEELPKWLAKGCVDNRVKLVIDDTNATPKSQRR